ncbi:MAG TPA: ATP synthase F1 subunit delta [Chitinophagaceae bacterium]|jgi:F-type H+-transporting ATPase subunit delta|nr:ATP synthase F1 subunit delta [Chitinophagaceae bacterium]
MHNPRLAGRYAKSLFDLAVEKGELEPVNRDILYLQSLLKASRELINLLRSPVINPDKKWQIVDSITKDKLSVVTASFLNLMITKGREDVLPEIVDAFINMYNQARGVHRVKMVTAQPVSEEVKQKIIDKFVATTTLQHIELESVVREDIIGGFILEFDNNLVDASILRDLNDIKKQFRENIYIQNIR